MQSWSLKGNLNTDPFSKTLKEMLPAASAFRAPQAAFSVCCRPFSMFPFDAGKQIFRNPVFPCHLTIILIFVMMEPSFSCRIFIEFHHVPLGLISHGYFRFSLRLPCPSERTEAPEHRKHPHPLSDYPLFSSWHRGFHEGNHPGKLDRCQTGGMVLQVHSCPEENLSRSGLRGKPH